MRPLAAGLAASFLAFKEAAIAADAARDHGLAAGVLLIFFAMLGNRILGAWLHGR